MLDDTISGGGKCDGCGASNVPIMKLSLGRDFFGRVYDRLSPNADASPKWYCDTCSIEKNLHRDFRDIQQEFVKLHHGDASALVKIEQRQRAALRLKEITALIGGKSLKQTFLKPDEVSALSQSLERYQTAPST